MNLKGASNNPLTNKENQRSFLLCFFSIYCVTHNKIIRKYWALNNIIYRSALSHKPGYLDSCDYFKDSYLSAILTAPSTWRGLSLVFSDGLTQYVIIWTVREVSSMVIFLSVASTIFHGCSDCRILYFILLMACSLSHTIYLN